MGCFGGSVEKIKIVMELSYFLLMFFFFKLCF